MMQLNGNLHPEAFAWRLIRRAIATGVRAGSLSTKISKYCETCKVLENDSHLFFHCSFARAVWFSSKTLLRTSLLPFEQDGVQETLSIIINRDTSDVDLQRTILTLWYIWRARNDVRFKRKKWSVLQVHHAIEADIEVASVCARADNSTANSRSTQCVSQTNIMQENNSTAAGTHIDGGNAQARIQQQNFRLGLPSDQTFCRFPMLLPGARCYTDASIAPDMPNPSPRRAGLEIFILDPRRNFKFYIKVQIGNITSVIMAEAAALAFAATTSSSLQIGDISFLADSQLLVSFFNGTNLSSPPHREAKPFTQSFLNSVINKRLQVLKDRSSQAKEGDADYIDQWENVHDNLYENDQHHYERQLQSSILAWYGHATRTKLKVQWTQGDYADIESSDDEHLSYDLATRAGTQVEAASILDRVVMSTLTP
ncbi:uncharacterized protein [Miscanthus floridulus]|uniref:uncharacterized protein n=1 Tax=Miscanthus floridulus TaxID=154761 RepID=UPI003457F91F